MMEVATRMIEANPINGVGLSNYVLAAPSYDYTSLRISNLFPLPVHNLFLLIAAEIGLIGSVALLLFTLTVVRRGWRLTRAPHVGFAVVAMAVMLGMIGFLIHGLVDFVHVASYFPLWFVMGFLVGLNRFYQEEALLQNYEPTEIRA